MSIVFQKNFKKKFNKLSPKLQEQFGERLQLFLKDKFDKTLNNHSVERAFPNCRSININGDYRAIFEEDSTLVAFVAIGTHSELY